MPSNTQKEPTIQLSLQQVDSGNWRQVAALAVTEDQRQYVAEPSYYLSLCSYGELWHPLAIYLGDQVIGFMMWAVDPADNSCWLGGILIDQAHQRRGYGRTAIQTAIDILSQARGFSQFALSYAPSNGAKKLYHTLGFQETGEWEDGEVVARLTPAG